jgi:Flp pilus assembly protein TadD
MVLALGGDRQRAQAIAALAAAPAAVKAAAVAVQAGAGNALDARTRVELEIFALGVLGWGPEVEARVERIAREPSSDALLVWWALRGLGGRGDAALRLTLSRRLAALASTDVGVALDLSAALHNAGDDQAALSTLRDLAERYPESPEVALRLGMALEQGGDLAAAREQYARAASVNRPSPIALNNLAYLLAGDAARRPLAIAHARRAVALAPRSGDLLDTLGWLLYLEGQVEEAATVLARAAAALPAQPTIRYHLALALDAQGEAARAANHLDIALLSSAARFPEREAAKALLERLRAETKLIDQAALAGGDAPSLAPGAALDGKTGTDGLAVLKLAPGAAKEARLRFAAPADGPAEATILDGRKTWKHVAAPAGDEAAIARLALPAGDAGRIVVSAAPGKSFRIELGAPAAAGEAEVEPNERPQDAAALAPGSSLAGLFDGPADRDHVRLDIPPGKRASLAIAAGPRAELRIDVLAVAGSSERLAKSARLRAGEEAAIAVLAAPARGALVLRFAAGSSIAAQAAPFDWRARLDDAAPAAAGDAEPDDRIDDALALSPGTPAAGALGPLDAIDLYRIAAPPAETVAITLRDTTAGRAAGAASPLVLELWERTGDRTLPLRRYPLASGELSLARWRTPRAGDLFLAVGLAEGSRAATSYEVSVARAEPPAGAVETEPNDRPALADTVPAGTPLRASLDAPGDQDWVRVPVLGPGVPLALSLSGPAAMRGVVVSVISHPDTDARPVAVFDATGGALVVPAIRLPDGPAAVVVAATAGAAGAYELTLGPGPTAPEVEAEPDDDAANAIVLAPGRAVRGRVSGRADRDIFAVEGGRGVTVRATGAAPIAVLAQRDGATAQVVLPGKSVTLPADAIAGKGERAFVAIFAPREEGAAGEAASTAAAQAEASYEIREGEGGR